MEVKIPYNFNYNEDLTELLCNNKHHISSLYFSFSKGSRPVNSGTISIKYHLKRLEFLKSLLNIDIVYALNSVVPTKLDYTDHEILNCGIVDIVTLARDDIYHQVKSFVGKKPIESFLKYETSRFYNYITENTGELRSASDYIVYGFEKEIPPIRDNTQKHGFIVNENCYPDCDKKILHNTEVVHRNLSNGTKDFSCPYKEKRILYSKEYIRRIISNYSIDYLKLCDRTMTDNELMQVFIEWIPFVESLNDMEEEYA